MPAMCEHMTDWLNRTTRMRSALQCLWYCSCSTRCAQYSMNAATAAVRTAYATVPERPAAAGAAASVQYARARRQVRQEPRALGAHVKVHGAAEEGLPVLIVVAGGHQNAASAASSVVKASALLKPATAASAISLPIQARLFRSLLATTANDNASRRVQ